MSVELNVKIMNFRLKKIDCVMSFFYLFFIDGFFNVMTNIDC